jgi:hypothetical protein
VIWILMLVGAGATWAIVDALAVGFLLVGILIPVVALVFFANYVNDFTGVNDLLVESYQWIVGVENPNDMMPDHCVGGGDDGFGSFLLTLAFLAIMFVVAVGTALVGMASIVGIPVGMVATLLGSLASLVKRDPAPLSVGLKILTLALGGAIAVGFALRVMNEVFTAVMC